MKALTVQQPWAWAIIHGGKDIENRTQAWSYRGPLAIHAGARLSDRGMESPQVAQAALRTSGWQHATPSRLDTSAIIGTVELVDVHHHIGSGDRNDCCDSPWAESWYHGRGRLVHLELANPRPLDRPIPCAGRLGLWTPPPDTLDELRELAMTG